MGLSLQLVITMDEDGAVHVEGPTSNLVLCYGLLETAKKRITDNFDQAMERMAKRAIVDPMTNLPAREKM